MVHDLEELVLKCRDDRARAYIREAVGCYQAGAYRSCIVSTWIAIAFDIIDKIRELALAGDKEAHNLNTELEGIRQRNDLMRALQFERSLLDIAKDKFELISPVEYLDLQRISEDRNRCAHPSKTNDTDVFSPPAELARLHIRSAVEILLAHPPAQGKAALDGLLKTVQSDYFPTDLKKALEILSGGPLKRARHTLSRNLVVVLVKSILSPDTDVKQRLRYECALKSIKVIHPDVYKETLDRDLARLVQQLRDQDLRFACLFVVEDEDRWESLDNAGKMRTTAFVEQLPGELLEALEGFAYTEPFSEAAVSRSKRATLKEIEGAVFFAMPAALMDRLVLLYERALSFDEANSIAKAIRLNSSDVQNGHIEKIIQAAAKNNQITGSFQFPELLAVIRKGGKMPNLDQSLKDAGLGQFAR